MISPFIISQNGSDSEKELKIVLITKPLPRIIVPSKFDKSKKANKYGPKNPSMSKI